MERIEPAGWFAARVQAGRVLTIRQVEGQQAIDLVSTSATAPDRHLSMYVSQAMAGSWRLSTGATLFSVDATPFWQVIRDDCGQHYTGGGYCSAPMNIARYGTSAGDCRSNLEAGMVDLGGTPRDVTPDACFNGFMAVAYDPDGVWRIAESPARPGDVLALRALADQRVVISNCPQEAGPTNGFTATAIEVEVT